MSKTIRLSDVKQYLDELLKIKDFSFDASNNGLQFEGKKEVKKIAFGVDASLEFFRNAKEIGADMCFVHHGISWGGSLKRITGFDARRIQTLAVNDISLYAAHLPLDAHPGIGHNAKLAAMAELKYTAPFGFYDGCFIGSRGELRETATVRSLAEKFDRFLPSSGAFRIFGDPARKVSRIGIISGGGAFTEAFAEMEKESLECLVTGEMTHSAVSYAKETNASVIILGHYRSETPGVFAVMSDLKRYFDVETEFLDLPTGF